MISCVFRPFTVPYFSVRPKISAVEFSGPPSWSVDVNATRESTKCPWVGVAEDMAGGKNREAVTASLCLMFKGRGKILAPPLIKSVNNLLP